MTGLPAVPAFRQPAPAPTVTATGSTTAATSVAVGDVGDVVVEPTVAPAEPAPWSCNAAANCTGVAVVQWAAPAPTDDDPLATVPVFACADHDGVK